MQLARTCTNMCSRMRSFECHALDAKLRHKPYHQFGIAPVACLYLSKQPSCTPPPHPPAPLPFLAFARCKRHPPHLSLVRSRSAATASASSSRTASAAPPAPAAAASHAASASL